VDSNELHHNKARNRVVILLPVASYGQTVGVTVTSGADSIWNINGIDGFPTVSTGGTCPLAAINLTSGRLGMKPEIANLDFYGISNRLMPLDIGEHRNERWKR
jgi:hypothetical protein